MNMRALAILRGAAAAFGLTVLAMTSMGCGDTDETWFDPQADATAADLSETTDPDVLPPADATDSDLVADTVEPDDVDDAVDAAQEATTLTSLWTQLAVPGEVATTSLHGVWSDHPTRVLSVGTNGTILSYDGLQWAVLSTGKFPTLNAVSASPGAGMAFAVGMNGTLVQAAGSNGKVGQSWGPSGGCKSPSDCDDSDPCSNDICDAGLCSHAPSGATGCCGGVAFSDSFDKSLSKWSVSDLHSASGQGGIVWSVAGLQDADGKLRASSPPAAAYFGLPGAACENGKSPPCHNYQNGKVVGATLLSPIIDVPVSVKATLTFQLMLDVDSGTTSDLLRVAVIGMANKKIVWDKATELPNGKTPGFTQQTVDLTEFQGTKVRLEVSFDSVTSAGNAGEGVFVDDLLVTSQCAAGTGSTGKGLTSATLWGVYAAADDLAWAVGSDGTIARWNGVKWALENQGKAKEVYGFGGPPGGPAFGVGASGLLGTLGANGLQIITAPTSMTLRAVAVTPATDGTAAHAVAVGDNGSVLEWQDGSWSAKIPPAMAGTSLRSVTSFGGGLYAAVGNSQIFTRNPTDGVWTQAAFVPGVQAVAAIGPGSALAVGQGGIVYERKGNGWIPAESLPNSGTANAIHANGPDDVWVAGDNGYLAHRTAEGWKVTPSPSPVHLQAIYASGPNDVYAAGLLGVVMRWDGLEWTLLEGGPVLDWRAVWSAGPDQVIVGGKNGILALWNGKTWQVVNAPITKTLRTVWGSSPTNVWAAGEGGLIYRSAGSGWSLTPIEPYPIPGQEKPYEVTSTLLALWGSGPEDVWASGSPDANGSGVLVHWDGKSWTYVPALMDEKRTVRAIWGWKKDEVILAGTQGMALYWNGQKTKDLQPGSIASLFSVASFGKDALLVGDIGTVLRLTPIVQ
ncbi:MAG: hypothetical protein ACOYOB_04905 [Myxococcota bacterium]